MTCVLGSTRAPNLRTTSPSTSTRPAPIISSQLRRLPTPAAASTFCSRTPPGTSLSESRWPGSMPQSSSSSSKAPRRVSRRAGMTAVLFVVELIGQERRELGQLVQARQAQALEEVRGRAEQDRSGLVIGARLFDQAAQRQRAHDPIAVDPADSRHLSSADRLTVCHHGQGLECCLSEPDLLAVPDELLDD